MRYGPIRVFFQASYSWRSEGLFDQSFSIALPVQALRGLPYLGSFSVVPRIRHIGRPPWLGSYSVVLCIRHLMGQPLYCSAADAGMWREAMVMAPSSTCDSGVSPCFHGCLVFLHRHFPISSLTSPQSVFLQTTAALALGLNHNPKLQLPAIVPSRRPVFLPGICMALARTV